MPTRGEATGLFFHDGRVWVDLARVEAEPVRTTTAGVAPPVGVPGLARLPPPATAPAAGSAAAPATSLETTEPPPPPRPSLLAPPRRGELWELSALMGGYINLGAVAGGITGFSTVAYRFGAPLVVRAELGSFGLAVGDSTTVNRVGGTPASSNTIALASAHVLAGLDSQFIEVTAGLGGATLSNQSVFNPGPTPATGGVSVVAEGRFGARDGLALTLEWVTVGANGQFQFGSLAASGQIPLTERAMLVFRGGGGGVGVLWGDLGARVVVKGDGGPGTIALTGYFGGAGIDFGTCISVGSNGFPTCETTSVGGPSLGGGIEWRK
jgi:hypothetical protein